MSRPYTDDGLDVWHLASLEAHSFLIDEFFDTERQAISEQFLPASETAVFEIDGRVVGFVPGVSNEVGGIFVAPTHQNQRVGRALVDLVAATRRYLELEVFAANTFARQFYDAYGFRPVAKGRDDATGFRTVRLRIDGSPSRATGE